MRIWLVVEGLSKGENVIILSIGFFKRGTDLWSMGAAWERWKFIRLDGLGGG